MKNIYTISLLTFKEALSRKIFIFFFGVSSFILLLFMILFVSIGIEDLLAFANLSGSDGLYMNEQVAGYFKMFITVPLFGGGLFLSIFSVSSFIPNMLEKGNIDLLLSKPVSRSQVLLGKFFGGSSMVFVNIFYLVLGIWVLIGIKFGVWDPSFLLVTLTITFTFCVLYSLIIFIGILTKSSVLAMIYTYLIFFIFSPLLASRDTFSVFIENRFVQFILDFFYYITPQTSELGKISTDLASGKGLVEAEPIITSFLLMILILGFSISIFSKKDY